MANQYSKLTAGNIYRKVDRMRNPVTSLRALAQEFGVDTSFRRHDGRSGDSVPTWFREKVRSLTGTSELNAIRRRKHINYNAEGSTRGW